MLVETPKRMSASFNYVGFPFLIRPTVEFRLAPRHGLTQLCMVSPFGSLGMGLGYRFYAWGSFDRGLQLAYETGLVVSSHRHGTDEATFRALMAGVKHSFDFGLTLELQGGVAWWDREPDPNVNVNVGWSFWSAGARSDPWRKD